MTPSTFDAILVVALALAAVAVFVVLPVLRSGRRDQGATAARFALIWAALIGGCVAVWALVCGGSMWLAGVIG